MKRNNQYTHGGEVYDKQVTLDYSINVNPFGMPDAVKEAITANMEQYVKYPDSACLTLRKEISKANSKAKITSDMVLCGNGAADIIYRLCLAVKPKKAMVLAPTFSEYEQALHMVGSEVFYYELKEETGYLVEQDILEEIENKRCSMVFLCNPNNPIGNLIPAEMMRRIIEKCKQLGVLVVIDECFMEFTMYEETHSMVSNLTKYENVIIIKAFTKTYAMAGLRLGYALCADFDLLSRMRQSGPPWAVSSVAQVAGIAALKQHEYVEAARDYIKEEREYLTSMLRKIGCEVYHSETNYLVFKDPSHTTNPISLYERMLVRKILIRQCGNYHGLGNQYYRITVGRHNDNVTLIDALTQEIRM
ncbi:MAG: histidinol-phosphate transaminase [bacterium]|nr:histidinol-phosphate transaminase [bacterium]